MSQVDFYEWHELLLELSPKEHDWFISFNPLWTSFSNCEYSKIETLCLFYVSLLCFVQICYVKPIQAGFFRFVPMLCYFKDLFIVKFALPQTYCDYLIKIKLIVIRYSLNCTHIEIRNIGFYTAIENFMEKITILLRFYDITATY